MANLVQFFPVPISSESCTLMAELIDWHQTLLLITLLTSFGQWVDFPCQILPYGAYNAISSVLCFLKSTLKLLSPLPLLGQPVNSCLYVSVNHFFLKARTFRSASNQTQPNSIVLPGFPIDALSSIFDAHFVLIFFLIL